MLPLLVFLTTLPSMFATGCSAMLALKGRKEWVWFGGLAVLAGIGGLMSLNMLR